MTTPAVLRAAPDKQVNELEAGEWKGFVARLPCGHLVTFYRHFIETVGPNAHVISAVECPRGDCDGCYDVVLAGSDA